MRKLIVHQFISLDGVIQAPGGADEDTDGGFAVEGGMLEPVPDGGFGFSPASRASVEDFEHRAFQKGGLRALLGLPDNRMLKLRLHGSERGKLVEEFSTLAKEVLLALL